MPKEKKAPPVEPMPKHTPQPDPALPYGPLEMGFRVPTWDDIHDAFMRWLYRLFVLKTEKPVGHTHYWKRVTTRKVFDTKTCDKISDGKILKDEAIPLYNERVFECDLDGCPEVKIVRV